MNTRKAMPAGRQGEVATTLTIVSLVLMAVGIVLGTNQAVQKATQTIFSSAQVVGDLHCTDQSCTLKNFELAPVRGTRPSGQLIFKGNLCYTNVTVPNGANFAVQILGTGGTVIGQYHNVIANPIQSYCGTGRRGLDFSSITAQYGGNCADLKIKAGYTHTHSGDRMVDVDVSPEVLEAICTRPPATPSPRVEAERGVTPFTRLPNPTGTGADVITGIHSLPCRYTSTLKVVKQVDRFPGAYESIPMSSADIQKWSFRNDKNPNSYRFDSEGKNVYTTNNVGTLGYDRVNWQLVNSDPNYRLIGTSLQVCRKSRFSPTLTCDPATTTTNTTGFINSVPVQCEGSETQITGEYRFERAAVPTSPQGGSTSCTTKPDASCRPGAIAVTRDVIAKVGGFTIPLVQSDTAVTVDIASTGNTSCFDKYILEIGDNDYNRVVCRNDNVSKTATSATCDLRSQATTGLAKWELSYETKSGQFRPRYTARLLVAKGSGADANCRGDAAATEAVFGPRCYKKQLAEGNKTATECKSGSTIPTGVPPTNVPPTAVPTVPGNASITGRVDVATPSIWGKHIVVAINHLNALEVHRINLPSNGGAFTFTNLASNQTYELKTISTKASNPNDALWRGRKFVTAPSQQPVVFIITDPTTLPAEINGEGITGTIQLSNQDRRSVKKIAVFLHEAGKSDRLSSLYESVWAEKQTEDRYSFRFTSFQNVQLQRGNIYTIYASAVDERGYSVGASLEMYVTVPNANVQLPIDIFTPQFAPTENGPYFMNFTDLNDDGAINSIDFARLIGCITSETQSETCDINSDGVVNMLDLSLVTQYFGENTVNLGREIE